MRERLPPRHPKDSHSLRAVTRLVFAVRLLDAVTGERPLATPPLKIDRFGTPTATNRSGFHLFLDRSDDGSPAAWLDEEFTLTVGPHPFYRTELVTVSVSDDPSQNEDVRVVSPSFPALELTLVPTTAYPVRPWDTVVRGQVSLPPSGPDGERVPVENATLSFDGLVTVDDVDYSTVSTETGEYVLCVPDADAVTVAVVEGVPRVRVDGADPIITVEHPEFAAANDPEQEPVFAGRPTRWDVPLTE